MSTFDQMLQAIQGAVGTKYVWGGNSLSGGVDCSGFVQQVFKSVGIDLPRVSNQQANAGVRVSADEARPGDLVSWDLNGRNKGADHIGIYLGNGMVAEASSSRGQVVIRKVWGNAQFSRVDGTPTGSGTVSATGAAASPDRAQPTVAQTSDVMASFDPDAVLGDPGPAAPAFDVARLYELADPDDPGETPDTVGPYAVAKLMYDSRQPTAGVSGGAQL